VTERGVGEVDGEREREHEGRGHRPPVRRMPRMNPTSTANTTTVALP
jgi:hypothetical protein